MKSQVVFQDGLPVFVSALKTWLQKEGIPEGVVDDSGRTVKAVLDASAMPVLKNACLAGGDEALRAFRQAVFMRDDGRCELVSGSLAEEERDMVERLPAMAATPKSLARARSSKPAVLVH